MIALAVAVAGFGGVLLAVAGGIAASHKHYDPLTGGLATGAYVCFFLFLVLLALLVWGRESLRKRASTRLAMVDGLIEDGYEIHNRRLQSPDAELDEWLNDVLRWKTTAETTIGLTLGPSAVIVFDNDVGVQSPSVLLPDYVIDQQRQLAPKLKLARRIENLHFIKDNLWRDLRK